MIEPARTVSGLPSLETIYQWWDDYDMLDNIRAHSSLVAAVAMRLDDWLIEAGVKLDSRLIRSGALLHDIAKTPCLGGKCWHDVQGAKYMEELGQPEIARIVRLHVCLPHGHPLDEAMVVNYADKRVMHDTVVSLDQRYDYIDERYGAPGKMELLAEGRARAHQVEETVFEHIGSAHGPDELIELWRQKEL